MVRFERSQGGDSRGRGGFSRGGSRGGRDFEDRPRGRDSGRFSGRRTRPEMHDVICDKCGKECEVPFKPTSSKPVYCSDCFEKNDSRGGPSRGGSSRGGPSSGDLDIINEKLNKIMKALKIEDKPKKEKNNEDSSEEDNNEE